MKLPRYLKYKDSGIEWLGEVPTHWPVAKLCYRFEVVLGKMLDEKKISGDHLAPYLRNTDVQWGRINTEQLPQMDFDPEDRIKYGLREGDLLVCEGGEVGRAAIFRGFEGELFYQKAVHRLRPHKPQQDLTEFFYYHLFAAAMQGRFTAAGNKSTINHLPAETLRAYRFSFPSTIEQVAIAVFLDREIANIDRLAEKQRRLIELLEEKRQAVISHAVTKGLNPKAPMKPSGADWLGDVPAHWEVMPATALFRESKERAHENDQMLSATQKYGVIPLADFEEMEQRQVTKAITNLEMRKHVEIGDFVISMRSMDGGLERARAVGSVRSSYSVLKPSSNVEGRYFGALLKSSLYIQALRLTSNFIRDGQDLSFTHVRKIKLPRPGLEEQTAIAEYLDCTTARIDALIGKTEQSIELLRERRSALISAAVTGKIDLRGLASTEAA